MIRMRRERRAGDRNTVPSTEGPLVLHGFRYGRYQPDVIWGVAYEPTDRQLAEFSRRRDALAFARKLHWIIGADAWLREGACFTPEVLMDHAEILLVAAHKKGGAVS